MNDKSIILFWLSVCFVMACDHEKAPEGWDDKGQFTSIPTPKSPPQPSNNSSQASRNNRQSAHSQSFLNPSTPNTSSSDSSSGRRSSRCDGWFQCDINPDFFVKFPGPAWPSGSRPRILVPKCGVCTTINAFFNPPVGFINEMGQRACGRFEGVETSDVCDAERDSFFDCDYEEICQGPAAQ